MSYTKTQWRNNQSPAINADNLNHIEQGVYDAYQDIAENTQNIESLTTQTRANTSAIALEKTERQQAVTAETLARESTDNNLQAQIDQLVAPSGTAPNPAEIENARIGADGVTYDTLGNAIRTQFTNVKSEISNKVNAIKNIVALEATPIEYEWQTGKVISSAGIISNASGESYKVSDYIPVEASQVVTCLYSRARWNNQNWAFYDANKNVVKTYGKTASAISVEYCQKIIAPSGAKYFVLARDGNGIANEPNSDVTIITKYTESIDNVPKSAIRTNTGDVLAETALTAEDISSKLISSSGIVNNVTSADYRVSVFTVAYGDVINIRNSQARYSNKMYAFYDASGLPINIQERIDNNAHDFMLLDVPFGAVSLAVSGYQSYATVAKVTAVTASNEHLWTGKKWACMGDSITDAGNSRATKRYFDYIHDATDITVVNLGKSGTGYMKPYNSSLPFYQRVDTIPTDSDVITIFGSGNDCSLTLGNVTDTGTDTICGCINNTIDGIRARIVGANIGIIAPTPWDDYPTYTENNMSRYVDALEQICKLKGVPFLNLYRCSNMLPWEESFRNAFYTHDDGNGVHPDENGHKFFAPHIYAFMRTLLM